MMAGPKHTEGKYRLRVKNQGYDRAKSGGLQFFLECNLVGKYETGQEGEECFEYESDATRTIFRTVVSKDQKELYNELVSDINAVFGENTVERFDQLMPGEDNFVDLSGHDFDAKCIHDTYNGKVTEKWEFANRGGGGFTPTGSVTNDEIKKMARLFYGAKGKPAPSKASGKKPLPPKSDDNIPY